MKYTLLLTLLLIGCSSNPTSKEVVEDSPTTIEIVHEETEEVTPSPVPEIELTLEEEWLQEINIARSESRVCGQYGKFSATDPLSWDSSLQDAALEHSRDMALSNTFSHVGSGTEFDKTFVDYNLSEGSSFTQRTSSNDYSGTYQGENIAAGPESFVQALQMWLNSPGHCRNIMNPNYSQVGVGTFEDPNSIYTYYWTQNFGATHD